MNEHIPPTSTVSRFRFSRPKNNNVPVPSDFIHNPPCKEMSVFETQHLKEEKIWTIGRKINPKPSLVGRCNMNVGKTLALENKEGEKLNLLAKRAPKSKRHLFFEKWWHVNIDGCPCENEEQYKSTALALVSISKYIANPHPKKKN